MNYNSLGDLSRSFAMQSRNATIKQDIERLTLELSTGQTANMREVVGKNASYTSDLERSLTKLDGYDQATRETGQFAEGMQNTLSYINELSTNFRDTMLSSSTSSLGTASTVSEAQNTLESVIGALNTSLGGRSLFSGMATDTAPLASAQSILSDLSTVMAGAGSVDDMINAAQAWFDDPAGFDTTGYLGSDTALAPMPLSETENVELPLRGNDPAFRDTLRDLALAALADDPALGLTAPQQDELLDRVTTNVVSTSGAIVDLQATVGSAQARIETLSVRNGAERTALEIARNNLLSVDTYQSATELEQVQFQLESLYAITSRMSQLSLVNYL
ncbi:MAG: flagellin [Sulfitobacter sp.]